MTILATTTIIAMESNDQAPSAIEIAAKWQTKMFIASIAVAALAAIIAILLFRAGNAYQESVRLDAEAKIATANAEAARANEATEKLKIELAEAKQKQADAETQLLKLQRPRTLGFRAFLEALMDSPPSKARIVFDPASSDGYIFGAQIHRWLGEGAEKDGANWNVLEPKPIPASFPFISGVSSKAPPYFRAGGLPGMGIVLSARVIPNIQEIVEDSSSLPIAVLARALKAGGYSIDAIVSNPKLPKDTVFIIIGPKL